MTASKSISINFVQYSLELILKFSVYINQIYKVRKTKELFNEFLSHTSRFTSEVRKCREKTDHLVWRCLLSSNLKFIQEQLQASRLNNFQVSENWPKYKRSELTLTH